MARGLNNPLLQPSLAADEFNQGFRRSRVDVSSVLQLLALRNPFYCQKATHLELLSERRLPVRLHLCIDHVFYFLEHLAELCELRRQVFALR